jgi:hypothetical protein
MKIISFLFVLILSCVKVSALVPQISGQNLGYKLIYAVEVLDDRILIAGYQKDTTGFFNHGIVKILQNDELYQLPDSIVRNGKNEPIKIDSESKIKIDSGDNIWLSGDVVYTFRNNKWHEIYFDDKYKEFRRYTQMAVDIYNNVWVTASYFVSKSEHKSEIFRITDDKIELVYQNDFSDGLGTIGISNNFIASSDGTVSVFESYVVNEKNITDTLRNQFLTISQDKTFERIPIYHENTSHKYFILKNSGILRESKDKIWFFNQMKHLPGPDLKVCCGGLTLLENNVWKIFKENDGLGKTIFYDSQFPVNSLIKLTNNKYFITGFGFYEMGEDMILNKLDINKVFDNSLFIPVNPNYNKETLGDGFRGFYDTVYLNQLRKPINIVKIDNENNIIIAFQFGILKIPVDILSTVDGVESVINLKLFPNPVNEIITLDFTDGFNNFTIFDLLGNSVLTGEIKSKKIDVSSLIRGFYSVRLYSTVTGSFQQIQFIKE